MGIILQKDKNYTDSKNQSDLFYLMSPAFARAFDEFATKAGKFIEDSLADRDDFQRKALKIPPLDIDKHDKMGYPESVSE